MAKTKMDTVYIMPKGSNNPLESYPIERPVVIIGATHNSFESHGNQLGTIDI